MWICLKEIAKYNLKFNILPHIIAALALLILMPVLFGVTALNSQGAAVPIETGLSFLGVILLIPVFSYEKDRGVLYTIAARKTSYNIIYFARIILDMLLIFLLIIGFVFIMSFMESEVGAAHILAAYGNSIFLGGLGLLAFAVTGNLIIGYVVPIMFFLMEFMGAFQSTYMLFSLARNDSVAPKFMLIIAGMIFIITSVFIRNIVVKQNKA